jgi:hypothetical protein
MRGISIRSLLISHLAMFILFCLFILIGYSVSLVAAQILSGGELSEVHQRLKADKLFEDVLAAMAMSLSAAAAGWLAARGSKSKPLIHGALSGTMFFLLFLYASLQDVFQLPENTELWVKPLLRLSELAIPLLGLIGASVFILMRRENSTKSPVAAVPDDLGDLSPIAWKWLVRLIWICSIATFQTLEVFRYRNGETYRPLFGLYTAVICALVIWYAAHLFRDARQRNRLRRQTRLNVG